MWRFENGTRLAFLSREHRVPGELRRTHETQVFKKGVVTSTANALVFLEPNSQFMSLRSVPI